MTTLPGQELNITSEDTFEAQRVFKEFLHGLELHRSDLQSGHDMSGIYVYIYICIYIYYKLVVQEAGLETLVVRLRSCRSLAQARSVNRKCKDLMQ